MGHVDKSLSPKQLKSFPLFSKLPTELRLKIWTFALTPRLVSIRCGSNPSSVSASHSTSVSSPLSSPLSGLDSLGCTSSSPLPATLHASAESRRQIHHLYHPSFGFARQPGHVLFNFDLDVLFLGPCHPREGFMASHAQFSTCMAMCDPGELSHVRRLALSSDVFCVDGETACLGFSPCGSLMLDVLAQVARRLPRLEELLFVPHHGPAHSAHGEEDGPTCEYERLTRQIQSALQVVCCELTSWEPPPWRVVSLDELATQMQVDAPEIR